MNSSEENFKNFILETDKNKRDIKVNSIVQFSDCKDNIIKIGLVSFSDDYKRFEIITLKEEGDISVLEDFSDEFIPYSPDYVVDVEVYEKTNAKFVGSIENDSFTLDVHECSCGYHMGIDSSFLDQVGPVSTICPSCGKYIFIEAY